MKDEFEGIDFNVVPNNEEVINKMEKAGIQPMYEREVRAKNWKSRYSELLEEQ